MVCMSLKSRGGSFCTLTSMLNFTCRFSGCKDHMNSDEPHRGCFRVFVYLHQELDCLSKSGDGLAGFLEGPNVFHASFAAPPHLSNDACKTKLVTCCSVGSATSKTFAVCRPSKG